MSTHPNAARFGEALAAFGRGDMEALATKHFAPDIVWHLAGDGPLSGSYKGQAEVFGLFGTMMERTAGTFSVSPHSILADDDHVVLLANATGTRPDGRRLDVAECLVMHVVDGRETEVWHSQFESGEWDAFWA